MFKINNLPNSPDKTGGLKKPKVNLWKFIVFFLLIVILAGVSYLFFNSKIMSQYFKSPVSKTTATPTATKKDVTSLLPTNNSLTGKVKPVISADYNYPGVSTSDIKLYVDNQEITASSTVTKNSIKYIPSSDLLKGPHSVKLAVNYKGTLKETTWQFNVLPGDVNADGKVDTIDLDLVSKAMNTKPGDAKWDDRADLNSDQKVDIFDLTIVSKNQGNAGPIISDIKPVDGSLTGKVSPYIGAKYESSVGINQNNVSVYVNDQQIVSLIVIMSTYFEYIPIQALEKGDYTVKLKVTDDDNKTTEATWHFTVSPGDVNADGKVDDVDLQIISKAFGSGPNDSNWNSDADLNNDSKIDIFDLTIASKNYNDPKAVITSVIPASGAITGKPKPKITINYQKREGTTVLGGDAYKFSLDEIQACFLTGCNSGFLSQTSDSESSFIPIDSLSKGVHTAKFTVTVLTSDNRYVPTEYTWQFNVLPGDVDLSGKVDDTDMTITSIAFGTQPGDAKWDDRADLNSDQKIDIFDLVISSKNYGSTL